MASLQSGHCRCDVMISLPASLAYKGSAGNSADAKGSFVLQGQETVEKGKIKSTWFVVPGSGTGELSGLRGEGGFEGDFGKGPKECWIIGSSDVVTIVVGPA